MLQLKEKLAEQTKTIEQLTWTVQKFETEKSRYRQDLRELRNEITQLNSRIMERGMDVETEKKIDQWKKEVMSEIHYLKTEIKGLKSQSWVHYYEDTQLTNIIRDIIDLRKSNQEEMESVRREMELLRSRMMKIEQDLIVFISERKEPRFPREQGLSNSIYPTCKNCSLSTDIGALRVEKLDDVRASILSLKNRIGNLERALKMTSEGRKRHSGMKGSTDHLTSNLYDFSEDEDLFSNNADLLRYQDLISESCEAVSPDSRIDSDENTGINLSDLDLSDDNIFPQADPFNSEDFY